MRRGFGTSVRRGGVAVGLLMLAVTAYAAVETVSVVVQKTSVRKDRQFYAPTLAEASYRDKLEVLVREKGWVKVRAGSVEGWVHESAVTAKKVAATSGGTGGAVTEEDVALAGKGFNRTVEGEYRRKNPGANFDAVDRMERVGARDEWVGEFVREGNLAPREGGK